MRMRMHAGAPPAWIVALLAAATVAVVGWSLRPHSEPPQWPTVGNWQVVRAVRAQAGPATHAADVTCRPVAFAWRCLVRYRNDRTATCNVGLRARPPVNREPRFTVIC
ncbi:MAG: hypothetical protein QOK04_2972 [Solirubrobacteraceae bacterium]|jgi:hypothetical protein|nr:hypothetical protein [Solirubrobacteraceae bacterium]